jgi:hypothetical protein
MKNTTLSNFDMANIFNVYMDDNGQSFYNLYNSLNISGEIDPSLYSEYYFTDADDWYTLAYRNYQDIRLWWIILVVNNIINPFVLPENRKIKIPNSAVVNQIISQINLLN